MNIGVLAQYRACLDILGVYISKAESLRGNCCVVDELLRLTRLLMYRAHKNRRVSPAVTSSAY